jgi:hypothetical protein
MLYVNQLGVLTLIDKWRADKQFRITGVCALPTGTLHFTVCRIPSQGACSASPGGLSAE